MTKGVPGVPAGLAAVRAATQFKPGHNGRPKGTRDKLGKRFVEALSKDFDEHGESAISAARERDPVGYMKVVASLLPKQLTGEGGESLFSGVKITLVKPGDADTTIN
jgi:hypothetical protein